PQATYGYILKTASRDRLLRGIQCVFADGQNIIDREVRGIQQRGMRQSSALTESEYEILLDIAIGLTDQTIALRRNMSMRSVQARLQQLYAKLGLEARPLEGQHALYNSRCRAVALAITQRLINGRTIEIAAAEFNPEA
ncbi:MAG: LuxR C-terminal-related transcriptional regulator, partial [bacterium]